MWWWESTTPTVPAAALEWAARQAFSTGCRLTVVHAYELDIAWIDDYNPAIPQWERHAQEAALELLSRVAEEVLDAAQLEAIELRAIEGSPADVLHDEARDAALLVVGSRGRGGCAGLLLGSVSPTAWLNSAPCPVVIVPLPGDG